MLNRSISLPALAVALLILGLQVDAVARQSLTGDAAYHLLAGHQALRYGENRLNLEHPPLVKMVAAIPLLSGPALAPPSTLEGVVEASLVVYDDGERLQRAQWGSRALILLCFGLPFLAACFFLGQALGGRRTGLVLAAMLGLSISSLPNLSILQTDTAVSLGFLLCLLGGLRYLERPGLASAAGLGAGLGLALASKFSGVLLVPTVVLAVFLARERSPWRRSGDLLAALLIAFAFIGSTYAVANRSYDSEAGRETIRQYCRGEALIVEDRLRDWEEPLLAIEQLSPSAAQWLTGFLGIRAQNAIGVYPTYAFGELSTEGRWWYFPALLLVETPLALCLASLAAFFFLGWRIRNASAAHLLLGATGAVYLLVALTSSYNLGVRHLLPVLPLLYLPAAAWAAGARWRTAAVVCVLAAEALAVAPLWMSATNTWWLGNANPTLLAFSTGNTEYHQNFLALRKAAEERGIEALYVMYPLLSPRELRAYLPTAQVVGPDHQPRAGGWYAVNIIVEQFLPAAEHLSESMRSRQQIEDLAKRWNPLWQSLRAGEDHGIVAGTFHLYHFPAELAPTSPGNEAASP